MRRYFPFHSTPTERHLAKTVEVETIRFGQNDLALVGTLEYGQYSVVRAVLVPSLPCSEESQIDVVRCNLDSKVYVRKSIEKRFAYKTRDVRFIVV